MCDCGNSWDRIVREREEFLVDDVGILSTSLQYLKRIAPRLCDGETAKRRITHLHKLGFSDPIALVNYNPTLIMRKSASVAEKFQLWTAWLKRHRLPESANALSFKYPQMYTVSATKLCVIFAVSDAVNKNVTASRMCNAITLNLEDILCACIWKTYHDFAILRRDIIRGTNPLGKSSKVKKQEIILRRLKALPVSVADAYQICINGR